MPHIPSIKPQRNLPQTLLLLVLLLTVVVYIPGLHGQMIFDDIPNIVSNTWLHIPDLSFASIDQALYSGQSSALGRPLSMLSFALNYRLDGIHPFSYKLTNLLIHLVNGVLIFWLLSAVLQTPVIANKMVHITNNNALKFLPWFITAAWLLNPIHVSTVLYVVQRMSELASLFIFLGLAAYVQLRLALNQAFTSRHQLQLSLAIAGCTVATTSFATLAKETGALLPLYLLMVETLFFRFQFTNKLLRKGFITTHTLLVGIPTLIIIYTLIFHFDLVSVAYQQREFSMEQRLLSQPEIIGLYLKMMLFPVLSDFGLHHDDLLLSTGLLHPPSTLVWIIVLGIALSGSLLAWRKFPLFSFGILFFLASHSIESSIIGLELAYEHRNYPGSLGILLALFSLLLNPAHLLPSLRIRRFLAIVLIGVFSTTTLARTNLWGDTLSHSIHMQQNHPFSPRSALGAAQIMAQLYRHNPVKYARLLPKAKAILQTSNRYDPNHPSILTAAILLQWFGKQDTSIKQIEQLVSALKRESHRAVTPSIFSILSNCRKSADCPITHQDMLELFQSALDNPSLINTQRAHILSLVGTYATSVLGDIKTGIEHQKMAIAFAPKEPRHWINLVRIHILVKDYNAAQATLNSYLETPAGKHSRPITNSLQTAINQGKHPDMIAKPAH